MLDVIAVNIEKKTIRILSRARTPENAETIITMAVMRRGVDTEFYTTVPANKFKDGDDYFAEA